MNVLDMVTIRPRSATARGLLVMVGLALLLALAAIGAGGRTGPEDAMAFDHTWTTKGCSPNVVDDPSERGIWDDAPVGGGIAGEAGFAWVKTNSTGLESCTWRAYPGNISSGTFDKMQVRMAVNDGAQVFVTAARLLNCGQFVGFIETTPAQADGTMRTFTVDMSSVGDIKVLCFELSEVGDGGRRMSVLIDRISIFSSSGPIGWDETFSRPK